MNALLHCVICYSEAVCVVPACSFKKGPRHSKCGGVTPQESVNGGFQTMVRVFIGERNAFLWGSSKVSHKRVFALLTPEIRGYEMAQILQKPVFALPGCQRMSANTLLCDTLGLPDFGLPQKGLRKRGCNSLILELFAFVCVCLRLCAFISLFGPLFREPGICVCLHLRAFVCVCWRLPTPPDLFTPINYLNFSPSQPRFLHPFTVWKQRF